MSKQQDILVNFINEGQNPLIVKDVYAKVQSMLTTDEHVVNIFVQHKLIGLNASVIVTNWRLFIHRPKIIGGADIKNYLWRLLGHPDIAEGPIYSTFKIETRFEPVKSESVPFLPKLQALRLYALAKEQADWWDEEHRLRNLELQRAASGGLVLKGGLSHAAEQPHPVVPRPHAPFPFHQAAPPHSDTADHLAGGPAMQPQKVEELPPEEPPPPAQPLPASEESSSGEKPHPESHFDRPPPSSFQQPPGSHEAQQDVTEVKDPVERLREIKQMLDKGLISKEEYQQKRQRILEEI